MTATLAELAGAVQRLARSRAGRILSTAVLVAGLVLVAAAFFLVRDRLALARIASSPWSLLVVLAAATHVASSLAAWRTLVEARHGSRLGWRAALRHLAWLLVGKYVPGKVFGLSARTLSLNADGAALGPSAVTNVLDQALMLGAGALVAAVLHVAAQHTPAGAVVAGVVIALVAIVLALRARAPIAVAACYALGWIALSVSAVALAIASGVPAALAVSIGPAYVVSIILGMLALVAPGGIAVREAGFVAFCAPLLGAETALALAVALRLVSVGVDAVVTLAALAARDPGSA